MEVKEGLGEKGERRRGEGYERLRKRNNIMCISCAYHVTLSNINTMCACLSPRLPAV